jgi:hypothetical protein
MYACRVGVWVREDGRLEGGPGESLGCWPSPQTGWLTCDTHRVREGGREQRGLTLQGEQDLCYPQGKHLPGSCLLSPWSTSYSGKKGRSPTIEFSGLQPQFRRHPSTCPARLTNTLPATRSLLSKRLPSSQVADSHLHTPNITSFTPSHLLTRAPTPSWSSLIREPPH